MAEIIETEITEYHNGHPEGQYWLVDSHWQLEMANITWCAGVGHSLEDYEGNTRYQMPFDNQTIARVKALDLPTLKKGK